MKSVFTIVTLVLVLLLGTGANLLADEQTPPPDPGLGGGGLEPGDGGGEGDDNPWGGEDRSIGFDGIDVKSRTYTLTSGIITVKTWFDRFFRKDPVIHTRPLYLQTNEISDKYSVTRSSSTTSRSRFVTRRR